MNIYQVTLYSPPAGRERCWLRRSYTVRGMDEQEALRLAVDACVSKPPTRYRIEMDYEPIIASDMATLRDGDDPTERSKSLP